MRIGEVIGTVTLNRAHPALERGRFRIATPLTLENLQGDMSRRLEPIVLYDELGAGQGSRIAMSEGREACQPFLPEMKPLDAYAAAILDTINL